jgi:hypothetical protein
MVMDQGFQARSTADDTVSMSDAELLSSALLDALEAHRIGLVVGPGVDEVALRRAERRARRADAARLLDASSDGAT